MLLSCRHFIFHKQILTFGLDRDLFSSDSPFHIMKIVLPSFEIGVEMQKSRHVKTKALFLLK